MKCPKCGSETPTDAVICACGHRFVNAPDFQLTILPTVENPIWPVYSGGSASSLPSFSNGLPVTMNCGSKTVTLNNSTVHIKYGGLWRLFRRKDREIPISEFKSVQIEGSYSAEDEDGNSSVDVYVKLIHQRPLKNIRLAESSFDVPGYQKKHVKPLLDFWQETAKALSLPAVNKGISTSGEIKERELGLVGW